MNSKTEHRCPECGAYCTVSYHNDWLECPICSRVGLDFHPPDPLPGEAWGVLAADGVEMAMPQYSSSLIEHANEH